METRAIEPLAIFDFSDGKASLARPDQSDLLPERGYRWLHFDLQDQGLHSWVKKHLPDVAGHALLQNETRPRCERYEDGLILNLRGVNLNPEADPEDMVSLRMWVTDKRIVSARLRRVWALDAIRRAAEAGSAPTSIGRFLAELAHALTSRIETVSLELDEQTDALEEAASEGLHLPAGKLSRIRIAVIKMRRFVNPQREALAALAALDGWIIAPDELALLRETSNRTRRIVEELDATRDRLSAIQDQIDAERAHVLGRNSYVLSVVAAIFLPLGFLTGLFGVNVAGMPGTTAPLAFWVLSGASVASGVALFLIFKLSRWL